MIQLNCPYCKSPTRIVDAAVVYGRSGFGRLLICTGYPGCDAYVSIHSDRTDGKGSLARGPLRRLRRKCHELFDPLWERDTPLHRQQLYRAAAKFFHLTEFHIGHLDETAAQKFIEQFPTFRARLMKRIERQARLAPASLPHGLQIEQSLRPQCLLEAWS